MDTLKFTITNNAWINNGLARLVHEMEDLFEDEVLIKREYNSVELSSNTEQDIFYYLNEVIKFLAANGTYNYAQVFKIINKELDGSFSPPSDYPENKGDAKKKVKISKEYLDGLKEKKYTNFKSSEQIWKMRLSYLGQEDKYLKWGLNFNGEKTSKDFKIPDGDNVFAKLKSNDMGNGICPNCGKSSNNFIESKQYFNPLLNEHHNNQIEGFGQMRKKINICPNCATLAIVSLFDKYIPFYSFRSGSSNKVVLALPNIYDLNILEKIINNLSLKSQFVDFSNPLETHYSSNILNFRGVASNSAALLTLLHNILNNFSKEPADNLFQTFSSSELMDLVDWIFITDSSNFSRIKANNNVFKILKVQKDPKTGEDIYLVNNFFNKIVFEGLSPYKIEKFFKSFIDLDYDAISQSLFQFLKDDVRFFRDSTYPIYLFKEVFLNQIMGEILMLDDEFKKSCKSIAGTIGSAFYKDIGLLSKFAYATDEVSFKEYIEESFFLMAKRSALNKDVEYYSNIKDLDIFFEGLTSDSFKETKSYFVSFMSSSAIHKKWYENNKEKKSEGGN